MDNSIHNPHDSFVRKVLDDLNVSRDLLQNELPEAISSQLDLSTLERINANYVSQSLRQTYSDMVFRVRYAGSDHSAYIYTLFEHKSQPDDWCSLQLLKYIVAQWDSHLQKQPQAKLPPIIPIVLYHGRQRWKRRDLVDLLEIADPDTMRPYTPRFDYVLWDVARMDREKLELGLETRAFLDLLYHIQRRSLIKVLPKITSYLAQATDQRATLLEKIEIYLRYAINCNEEIDEQVIEQSLDVSHTEDLMPTLAQKWFDEGRQEGVQEGQTLILRNLLLNRFGRLSPEVEYRIAQATDEDIQRYAAKIFDANSPEEIVGLKH